MREAVEKEKQEQGYVEREHKPRLSWSQSAGLEVGRIHAFLTPKRQDAARPAVRAIRQGMKALGRHPETGRPIEQTPRNSARGLWNSDRPP